jgi:CheY-like chemotaxis protein
MLIARPVVYATRLLVVQTDPGIEFELNEWQQYQPVRLVLTSSVPEALEVIKDVAFIEGNFDAMLCQADLPGSGVYKVLEEFRHEFPAAAAAVISRADDICLQVWTRSHRIRVFRTPFQLNDLRDWVAGVPTSLKSICN